MVWVSAFSTRPQVVAKVLCATCRASVLARFAFSDGPPATPDTPSRRRLAFIGTTWDDRRQGGTVATFAESAVRTCHPCARTVTVVSADVAEHLSRRPPGRTRHIYL